MCLLIWLERVNKTGKLGNWYISFYDAYRSTFAKNNARGRLEVEVRSTIWENKYFESLPPPQGPSVYMVTKLITSSGGGRGQKEQEGT